MWRPFDDAMLVLCSDKTLYVWQMGTGRVVLEACSCKKAASGMLDRVVGGLLADEIVACSREMTKQWLEESLTSSAAAGGTAAAVGSETRGPAISLQMLRALKHRNIDAVHADIRTKEKDIICRSRALPPKRSTLATRTLPTQSMLLLTRLCTCRAYTHAPTIHRHIWSLSMSSHLFVR